MKWRGIRNGELLARASNHFDVFVTVDRNLSMQQNVSAFPLSVIVLCAATNRLADLQPLVPELVRVLDASSPGRVTLVGAPT